MKITRRITIAVMTLAAAIVMGATGASAHAETPVPNTPGAVVAPMPLDSTW